MSRDTLLLVTTSYPEVGDGSEAAGAFVSDIAQELSARMPVRVVAPGRKEGEDEKAGGPRVWRFAGTGKPLSLLTPANPADWPKIAKVLISMRRQTHAAIADGGVRHILALWALPSGWIARGQARYLRIPYSVWALGSDIWSLGRMPIASMLLRRVVTSAATCFADGLQLAEDAAGMSGRAFEFLPSSRRQLLADRPDLRANPPWRLLFLGRWHPNKGIDLLLDALSLLSDEVWVAIGEVAIAGGGPMDSSVRAGVDRLQALGRPLRLMGFLDADQAACEIVSADWVLIPSRIESIPVVLSDALKAGRPLIVTPVGDMARIVAGSPACGIVASKATAPAFAAAIAEAISRDPRQYVDGVLLAASAFDLARIADRIHTVVKEAAP